MTFRVRPGDRFALVSASGAANRLQARVRIRGDNGTTQEITLTTVALNGTRVPQGFSSPDMVQVPGIIEQFTCRYLTTATVTGLKRGQCYVEAGFVASDEFLWIASGYVYDGWRLALGNFVEPGPISGHGHKRILTLGTDVAGTAATSTALAITNGVRKWYGVVVYYNASAAAASRVINLRLGATTPIFGAVPTGFTGSATINSVWSQSGPTLTTTQEGSSFFYSNGKDGVATVNDNGTLSTLNHTTQGFPFPYEALEEDPGTFDIDIDAGDADDVYSAYALVEDWTVI